MNRLLEKFSIVVILLLSFYGVAAQPSEEIRLRIEWIERHDNLTIEGIPITAKNSVKQFYYDRFFEPAWNVTMARELLMAISKADEEGLNPADYYYDSLTVRLTAFEQNRGNQADLDVLLTHAYLIYGSHLIHGKVDPRTLGATYRVQRKEKDIVPILKEAILNATVRSSLQNLNPDFLTYIRLKDYLRKYRQMQGSTTLIPFKFVKTIEPGDVDPQIPLIRERLLFTGDLREDVSGGDSLYDNTLFLSVRQFQERHGLASDGRIGERTIHALNISLEERIKKIIINMERCRWLPEDLGSKYILVNIPSFRLRYVVQNERIIDMDVVVGKNYRQTPVFTSTMTYMVFNPYWYVPPTILREDMLPAMRKNPNHLDNIKIKVLSGSTIIPSTDIDWNEIRATSFPYALRQDPGPHNALGVVKFMFPNEFNVYLHDTNNRDIFKKEDRDASSGCIRVSQPLELARLLLQGQEGWTMERIESTIKKEQNYTVRIKEHVTVHLQYWTAFTDPKGLINFRRDIYERDEKVWKALNATPASI